MRSLCQAGQASGGAAEGLLPYSRGGDGGVAGSLPSVFGGEGEALCMSPSGRIYLWDASAGRCGPWARSDELGAKTPKHAWMAGNGVAGV